MNYGLNISASGVLTAMYRMDVLANNLANLDTAGFKIDVPATRQRDAARIEDGLWGLPSNAMLERLGAGVMLAPNRIAFEQGGIEATGNPLDLAIEGDGFFLVRTPATDGTNAVRLTRDGRFTLGPRGDLVSAGTGAPLLDEQQRPIRISGPGRITIQADGSVIQNGDVVAKLALVGIPDPTRLTKQGHSLFAAPPEALSSATRATGRILQGSLERSTVDEVKAIMDITTASRDVEANIGMVQHADRLMDRAINGLGRVS